MTAEKIFLAICIIGFLFCTMRYWYYQGYINGLKEAKRIINETFKKNENR